MYNKYFSNRNILNYTSLDTVDAYVQQHGYNILRQI